MEYFYFMKFSNFSAVCLCVVVCGQLLRCSVYVRLMFSFIRVPYIKPARTYNICILVFYPCLCLWLLCNSLWIKIINAHHQSFYFSCLSYFLLGWGSSCRRLFKTLQEGRLFLEVLYIWKQMFFSSLGTWKMVLSFLSSNLLKVLLHCCLAVCGVWYGPVFWWVIQSCLEALGFLSLSPKCSFIRMCLRVGCFWVSFPMYKMGLFNM